MGKDGVSVDRVRFDEYETGIEETLKEYHEWVAQEFHEFLSGLEDDHEFSTGSYVSGELEKDRSYLRKTDSKQPVVVALDDERVVGCVYLYDLSRREAEIKRLYVRNEYRGLGLGRRLMNALIETAERNGYSTLRLDTTPSMNSAQHLYSELGFEPYDDGESISDIPQPLLDDITYMRLRLSDER